MSQQEEQPGQEQKKIYVLDTNVLLHDPLSLFNFEGAHVGIPMVVLEELENFKGESSDRGKNTREVVRHLDKLRDQGSLKDGVRLDNGGVIKILFTPSQLPMHSGLNLDLVDNEILLTAAALKKEGYDEVRFISKDLNARIKADVLGLETEDYKKGYVSRSEFYKGWVRLLVPSVQLKKEFPDDLLAIEKEYKFTMNEYVLAESQHNEHHYKLFRYIGGNKKFKPVHEPKFKWPLQSKNAQQLMALDLLLDPDIQLVSLVGQAGTGKTFMALLAGIHQVLIAESYQKMLISRPVVPLGPDIGYLPGDMQEKLHTWMQPVYDNVDVIIHSSAENQHLKSIHEDQASEEHHDKDKKKKKGQRKEKNGLSGVDDLVARGKLSLEAITYMRGRSIPYQFILIDEVQNLSPHEVKTIISRVGKDSKIILCGDPYQFDSPYLDFSSNGLVVASNKFKDQSIFGTVFLEKSERSLLSHLAGELL